MGAGFDQEIVVPSELPVMTLPKAVFFPQSLMPLHIFEPRYRQMLADVLAHDRLFAVAGLDVERARDHGSNEPPFRVAGLGIVRACQKNDNGTSNLLLQGLCRVAVLGIVCEEPYRRIRVRALRSRPGVDDDQNQTLRRQLARLLNAKRRLGGDVAPEITRFLGTVEDPEVFVDLAASNLCDDARLRQRLLETLNVNTRLRLFCLHVRHEIEELKLRRKLQGPVSDDRISDN